MHFNHVWHLPCSGDDHPLSCPKRKRKKKNSSLLQRIKEKERTKQKKKAKLQASVSSPLFSSSFINQLILQRRKRNPNSPSRFILTHDLGGLHSIHLLRPSGCRLELANRANFIQRVARNANVVVALENNLNVANVQCRVWSDLGQAACSGNNAVDKVVGQGENRL
jgi:hypothetical protein